MGRTVVCTHYLYERLSYLTSKDKELVGFFEKLICNSSFNFCLEHINAHSNTILLLGDCGHGIELQCAHQ